MYEDIQAEYGGARHLWQMDCVAITTLLTHGIPATVLRDLVARHSCRDCHGALDDAVWVLQVAHQACHKATAFTQAVEAVLDARYADEVARVRDASCLEIARDAAAMDLTPTRAIALQWALLTDVDPDKQRLGHHMAHALLLRGARDVVMPAKPTMQFACDMDRTPVLSTNN